MDNKRLNPVGTAHTCYKELKDCPRQGGSKCPEAQIEIKPEYKEAMSRMYVGQKIIVITWLDRADRNTLQCRPRGDANAPIHGIFCTRSPNRPNPIGLHPCQILKIKGNMLGIDPLEVLDKTPVLDIKPEVRPEADEQALGLYFPDNLVQDLIDAGGRLWQRRLLSGFNGNLSIRLQDRILITRSGAQKGHLKAQDLVVMEVDSGNVIAGVRPSSEAGMHLEIYRRQKEAQAIVHTHPPHLLAFNLQDTDHTLCSLPLFESDIFRPLIKNVPPQPPGSSELAHKAGIAAKDKQCLILEKHGLVCFGEDLNEAVALSEEIEALAQITLLKGT
ncbi:MAG: tRNA (N6-threonylcarbamoyladenosine(37)-N6)-methyltransferase TrmO [Desulfovibrionales bacterium]